ncbi:MAG: VTT domain-containing protein [Clostridia bacterium]|nr:VTT domain-containing protein [Clostridia bacterium]
MAMKKETVHKLYIALGAIVVFALLMLLAFSGDNFVVLKNLFTQDLSNEEMRDLLNDFGWRGKIAITVMAMLQVVCAFLPAEPVQVLGGFTFGFPVGLLCCMVGVLLGNTLIYILQNVFGDRLRGFFVKKLGLDLEAIAHSGKCVLIIFILYFLPAIPYGMICFFAASTGMSYRRFIVVTGLGSIPSVCIGVGLGYMAVASNWVVSACIFAVLMVILVVMFWKKDRLFAKLNNYAEKSQKSKHKVRSVNGFVMNVVYFAMRAYLFLCGVRVKTVNKVGTPETPSIVLCNHGSFIDFIYAAALLRKFKPNFIVARLYFYHNLLGGLLRTVGAFPKSMFATDIENVKNCLTVLKEKNHLAMMPEARLSTVGRFEDIQPTTYAFIKKAGVSVYTVKLGGDYFADPKWGKGFRRGALVEAELDILYTAEQVESLSLTQLQQGIEERLRYDEFAWLEQHPDVRYRTKRMAEGLENVLNLCPVCGRKHTITTTMNKVFCEQCGYLTSVTDRYAFTGDFRFAHFAQWYDWQKEQLAQEIITDAAYALTSEVELRLPSDGKGLTRQGGRGVCTLTRDGLTYVGTKDGDEVQLQFSIQKIYRLLFGAGENFEVYDGSEILYFVPKEKRSAVDWYMTSMILHDEVTQPNE